MARLLPRRTTTALVAATLLCLGLGACGSRLDPSEVAAANGGGTGQLVVQGGTPVDIDGDGVGDAVLPPDASEPGVATDPGAGTPGGTTDPGTGTDPGSGIDPGAPAPSGGATDAPPEQNDPVGGAEAGSCDGFENSTGITADTITLANASDISGPVPGLFEASRQATQAFIDYFNSSEDICGRKLTLLPLDSRADAGGDQQAYAQACDQAFAVVGSTSSQDVGGAATAQQCGIPDIRAFMVTPERQRCSTCFSAYTISSDQVSDQIPAYWKSKEPEASQHVAIFYVNVAAAKANTESFAAAYERGGMHVELTQPIETSEFNYAPYVQQMKDKGIQFVQYFGPYQFALKLQQAMKQNGFTPKVFFEDPTIYDQNYTDQANAAGVAKGVYVYSPNELFDDTSIREMALYRQWLEQAAPGAKPNYYGLFAWSAARLFVQEATKLGGKLDRASLVAAMRKVKGWTSNGLHAPMAIGAKTTSPCIKIIQYDGSRWTKVSSGDFMCGGLIDVG